MNNVDLKPEEIIKFISHFEIIYDESRNIENEMPDNVKLTVYCESESYRGFVVNATTDEFGFEALIARKWILHSKLENLMSANEL